MKMFLDRIARVRGVARPTLVSHARRGDIPRMLHVTPDVCKVPKRFADVSYNVTRLRNASGGRKIDGNSIYIRTGSAAQISSATKSPRRGREEHMRRLQI